VIANAALKQDGDTASGINGVAFEDRLLIDDPSGLLLGTGDAGTTQHLHTSTLYLLALQTLQAPCTPNRL
jgi:hypothetical protein